VPLPNANKLYHIPTACSPPGTLCTSCTSRLEQPVLYRFTSLHCMSLPSVQRVHSSVCAHAPFMPFLSLSRLLTCAVITRYLPHPSHYISAVAPSCYPPSTQRAYSHSARSPWVPMPSPLCHSLLPRLSAALWAIRLISTLLPHAATYTCPSPAYRT